MGDAESGDRARRPQYVGRTVLRAMNAPGSPGDQARFRWSGPGFARADFDGTDYAAESGDRYLTFTRGQRLFLMEDGSDWAYGILDAGCAGAQEGWFPAAYWKAAVPAPVLSGLGSAESAPAKPARPPLRPPSGFQADAAASIAAGAALGVATSASSGLAVNDKEPKWISIAQLDGTVVAKARPTDIAGEIIRRCPTGADSAAIVSLLAFGDHVFRGQDSLAAWGVKEGDTVQLVKREICLCLHRRDDNPIMLTALRAKPEDKQLVMKDVIVQPGDFVQILYERDHWALVSCDAGEGWLKRAHLKRVGTHADPQAPAGPIVEPASPPASDREPSVGSYPESSSRWTAWAAIDGAALVTPDRPVPPLDSTEQEGRGGDSSRGPALQGVGRLPVGAVGTFRVVGHASSERHSELELELEWGAGNDSSICRARMLVDAHEQQTEQWWPAPSLNGA